MRSNLTRFLPIPYNLLCQLLWAAAVIALPITSYPLLVHLTHTSTVAPLSSVFLGVLGLLWLLPRLLRSGTLPAEGKPLLWFVLAAVVTWAWAFFSQVPAFRERTILTEGVKSFITLSVGLVAYFVPAAWLSADRKHLKYTIALINLAGAVLIAWSVLQAYYVIYKQGFYPFIMDQFQRLFSSRGGDPLIKWRVTGFAYEPSWLAHQLNLVFLPIWLAATLRGYSAHRKIGRISLENILLLGGLFTLYVSASRIGWLAFFLAVASQVVMWNFQLARRIQNALKERIHVRQTWENVIRVATPAALLACFAAIYIGLGLGMLHLGASFEPRLAKLLKRNPFAASGIYEFANDLAFAERAVYWGAGLDIFATHPVFGVGLGNAGFYFPEKMPAFGWLLTEINNMFDRWTELPNIKSLWVRIPAETGLVGFGIFLGWIYLLWQSTRVGRSTTDPLLKTLAWAGTFAWIAFLIEGFSVDSLALPYFWFAMALITAVRSWGQRTTDG